MNKWEIIGILSLLVLGAIGGSYFFSQDKIVGVEILDDITIIDTEDLQNILDEIPQSLNNIGQNLENAKDK